MPHISIKAEPILTLFNFEVTNSLISTFVVLMLVFIASFVFYRKKEDFTSGYAFFIKFLMSALYSLFQPILKEKTERIFPVLASFFIFIILSNWFGLLPGVGSLLIKPIHLNSNTDYVIENKIEYKEKSNSKPAHKEYEKVPLLRAATADLNTTFALALISTALVQYYGFSYLGLNYLKKFFNFANPILLVLGLLELVSEISKVLSFSFRLFGNIFAGEVLLTIVAFLVPVLASFPFLMLELFVGLVQAIVFTMLTAVFINGATLNHH